MTPAKTPQHTTLTGRHVILRPLDPAADCDSLYTATSGPQDDLWRFLFDGPCSDRSSFLRNLEAKAASHDPLFFAIIDNLSALATGYAAYMRVAPAHGVIEVGSILFAPALQKTIGATEAMYLMVRHAFDDLGYRRYEWKCDALHLKSRSAALRLGFTFEGIFRQHMIVKGKNRDTAWFSMLDSEWPQRKANLESWLDPRNFTQGSQKQSLSALNAKPEIYPASPSEK